MHTMSHLVLSPRKETQSAMSPTPLSHHLTDRPTNIKVINRDVFSPELEELCGMLIVHRLHPVDQSAILTTCLSTVIAGTTFGEHLDFIISPESSLAERSSTMALGAAPSEYQNALSEQITVSAHLSPTSASKAVVAEREMVVAGLSNVMITVIILAFTISMARIMCELCWRRLKPDAATAEIAKTLIGWATGISLGSRDART
ncbi:hypothetical protein DOTSEDRAFT_75347 [Dothistroma septosporum NZE10]|uniref:Uncharacterized protein n=1 Tax=Dothistroma septosporum (strain NZE10 / CBS 128990) TaxID=675120 RepID=M2YLB8_DOTSN|nr:hypothetical protein DOTSEDRAFT_75347 [Dothistroma septosporum NZE10]